MNMKKFRALLKRLENYMKTAKKEGDKEDVAMIRGDIRDAKKILALVKAKQFEKLDKALWRMDTSPREAVWMCLDKKVRHDLEND